jgi:uncharacterized membrane protein
MPPLRVKRYLLTGLLTFIPLWVTWLVFKFVLSLLAGIGAPMVSALLGALALVAPKAATALNAEWLVFIVALLITLGALYLLGFVANRVIGQRFINAFDGLLARIPVVQTIYGGTKKLMAVLQNKPSGVQRVVLVEFPRRGMKVVGFVTRVMAEDGSGREMARLYPDHAQPDRRLSGSGAIGRADADRLDDGSGDGFHHFRRCRSPGDLACLTSHVAA